MPAPVAVSDRNTAGSSRFDAVQRDGDVGQQDGGIVVVGVGGDPAHPRLRALRPLGQQGRLAVTRRGDDRDHRRRAVGRPAARPGRSASRSLAGPPADGAWSPPSRRGAWGSFDRRGRGARGNCRGPALPLLDRTLPCQFVLESYSSLRTGVPSSPTLERTGHLLEEAGLQVADDVVDRVPADDERPPPRRAEREEQRQAQPDHHREADDQERGP